MFKPLPKFPFPRFGATRAFLQVSSVPSPVFGRCSAPIVHRDNQARVVKAGSWLAQPSAVEINPPKAMARGDSSSEGEDYQEEEEENVSSL